jgi:uncharacterized protein YlxW (UPF0749 family)
MTEIEKALLDALQSLQSEHEQQLSSFAETLQSMRIEHAKGSKLWAEAAAILQVQYERSQTENMALLQQVQSLSGQVNDLAQRVEGLSRALRK